VSHVMLTSRAAAQIRHCAADAHEVSATSAHPHIGVPSPLESYTNPVADPRAIVTLGRARFTVLTPELIRLEWAENGKFEDHASFVFLNRRLPVPPYEHEVSGAGQQLKIKTSKLTLTYTPGAVDRFTQDDFGITLFVDGKQVDWHPGLVDTENLLGTTRTLDDVIGDNLKQPMEPGLVSRSGWAVVDDSTRPLFDSADFRFLRGEESPWPWVMERPSGDRQDWYFFGYAHDYRKALGDYVRVAGRIPLPPRFAFGTWWSRFWAYTDHEIEEIVRQFRENEVPLDVFVIDMDWHPTFSDELGKRDASGHKKGWTGYSWNRLLFPDPDDFMAKLHADGLKISLNLHPASGIQPWEDHYPEMAAGMGVDPASQQYIPFDITDKRFARNYLDAIHHPLEKQGVDFWWLDWQQQANTKLPGVTPTWWLNYVHFTDQQREGKRPMLFHRWGGLGNHRYQIGFSGDTVSAWESLAFQPWFTATAANVGYAYWSHDIGGHLPGVVTPELYTRWVQFGAFSPILRTHTTKNPESERRIWAYPEPYSSILRSTVKLRSALQPYIYTEARRTYDTGVAFVRPLYYDSPQEDAAYSNKGEYLFGDQILVAPVTQPVDKMTGLAAEKVWLPAGEWIEWPTGKHITGPVTAERRFSIEQTPVYVRAGAIVPMQPAMRYTGDKPIDPLIVNIWPLASGQSSNYQLYEDSGVAVEYQGGVFTRLSINAAQVSDMLRVDIGPVNGSYPGMLKSRSYQLRLPADWPPESVAVNGVAVTLAGPRNKDGWSFEGNTLTTVIPVPSGMVEKRIRIEVHRAHGLTARRNELDSFTGAMTRLRGAYDALHQTWPHSDPPDILIDAMQTGDRIGYYPYNVQHEIAHFHHVLPEAQDAVTQIYSTFDRRMKDYEMQSPQVNIGPPRDADLQRLYLSDALMRARMQIQEAGN
jgi:alpha-glucosidase (family GH31 glycosyl hydrolase)